MRLRLSFLALLAVLAGCQGPILTGGFNQSPYHSMGVDGPGPGVMPEQFQPVSLSVTGAETPMAVPQIALRQAGPTSQVNFIADGCLKINWDAKVPGSFDSEPLICPATHDFIQGNVYRLKLTSIPNRPDRELYPTLEIAPTMARTQAFLAHNSIPVEFTDNDFDQVVSGNFITKVVYLPNPEFQGLAMGGVGTLVNSQLEPGVDPIVEASNRGAILAVIRMGNKDLSGAIAAHQQQLTAGRQAMPFPVNGSSIPQNMISGVNIPAYGTPMTKTSTGIPGPPQLPQGMHSPNRYPIVRAEPIPAPPSVGVTQPTYPYYARRAEQVPMPPRPIGVEPQNIVVNPHYTSQMQAQAVQEQKSPEQGQTQTLPILAPQN